MTRVLGWRQVLSYDAHRPEGKEDSLQTRYSREHSGDGELSSPRHGFAVRMGLSSSIWLYRTLGRLLTALQGKARLGDCPQRVHALAR